MTGPGRSGTSFIMQLLTRMGEDTGFEPYNEPFAADIRAGCEWDAPDEATTTKEQYIKIMESAPRILKSPRWGLYLKAIMEKATLKVDHVIIPLRDLDVSARSRLSVNLDWTLSEEYQNDLADEGDARVAVQERVLAIALGRTIEACYLFKIPCTIMEFPLFVEDVDYCYRKLDPIFRFNGDAGVDSFWEKFLELANPSGIRTAQD